MTCDGPGKKHYFCWRCNGYSSAPLDEVLYPEANVQIVTYVFCSEHLEELEACQRPYEDYLKQVEGNPQTIQDFVNTVQEARNMVRVFSDAEYSLLPMKPNGWCIFTCVARALSGAR